MEQSLKKQAEELVSSTLSEMAWWDRPEEEYFPIMVANVYESIVACGYEYAKHEFRVLAELED